MPCRVGMWIAYILKYISRQINDILKYIEFVYRIARSVPSIVAWDLLMQEVYRGMGTE